MSLQPLFSRAADDIFAWRPDGAVSIGRFIAEAHWLATNLPPGEYLLNVCDDRYRFALGFVAGLLTGKTSLQPASLSPETLRRIESDYPGTICLRDGEFNAGTLPCLDIPTPPATLTPATEIPAFDTGRVVAILFTSGSTGLPQPHRKTWGKLVQNARAGAAALGLDREPHTVVGTVPIQHSYGFESTFLLALHGNCPVWAGKPFYPQDIATALAAVPRPSLLVTTPFHLSALLAAEIVLPPVDLVLSATAPLSAELAARAETRCGTRVHEIYGSTETGQIATRRTVDGSAWKLLPEIRLAQEDDISFASGGHIETRIALGDVIELLPADAAGDFILKGRHTDLINIAGKRTSLAYLNHQITAVPGVVDAAFFLPDEEAADGITRLAAFVVAPTLDSRQLISALRQRLDPIFLPRPLVFLDALPRNSTGKLPRHELQALHAAQVKHG